MATSAPSPALQVFLKEHLLYVHTKAEAGEYADAMAALQETKASIKDNIYVRAVEQQLLTLLDLSRRNALTDERKTEILDPITGIIERAIGTLPHAQQETPSPAPQITQSAASPALANDEKQVALDRLKVQYFEQAGRHLSAGEYSLALAEIHRVFVIDPDNTTAKQYESIINELMNLKGRQSSHPASAQAPVEPVADSVSAVEDLPEAPAPEAIVPGEEIPEPDHELRQDEPVHTETVSEDQPPAADPVPEPIASPEEQDHDELILPEPPQLRSPLPPRTIEPRHVYSHVRQSQIEDHPPRTGKNVIVLGGVAVAVVAAVASFFLFFSGPSMAQKDQAAQPAASRSQVDASAASQNVQTPLSTVSDKSTPPTTSAQQSVPPASDSKKSDGQKTLASSSAPASPVKAEPKSTRSRPAVDEPKIQPVVTEEVSQPTAQAPPPTTSSTTPSQPSAQPVNVADAEPEPFIAVEKDPQLVKLQNPEIPDVAWGSSSDVQVILRVLVDADGKPVKAKVLKGDNPAIQNAAVNAVMKSTFTPGIMGKSAVTAWLTLPLRFHRN